jgi:hypothetical protein
MSVLYQKGAENSDELKTIEFTAQPNFLPFFSMPAPAAVDGLEPATKEY